MNYYERHLGDYARNAGHLSMLEHGAYTLLLDRYYTTDAPIPADQVFRLCRARTPDEIMAVEAVLAEFFVLDGNAYRNNRADEEIIKALARIEAAKENGKKGGRPKANPNPNETHQKPTGLGLGYPAETQVEAHHTPSIHLPLKAEAKATVRDKPAPTEAAFLTAWALYPKRGGGNSRADAMKSWNARLREGETAEAMTAGVVRYACYIAATGKERTEYVMQAVRFFGTGKHYQADWTPPSQPAAAPSKTMQALMNLNGMKSNGLDHKRDQSGIIEADFFVIGSDSGAGRLAWDAGDVARSFDDEPAMG